MTSRIARASARLVAERPRSRDGIAAAALGLVVRLGVVLWAAGRFPPADDGAFYDVFASRIARGLGYTWAWPDGVVTHAAHYPVGYPAMIAGFYALFGAHAGVAMAVNAGLGALSVLAVHRVASASGSRGAALLAAVAVALHPGLVFYTPALMTEGVTAALLAIAASVVVRARSARAPLRFAVGVGLVLGIATLVRPQSLLLAPLFGALSSRASGARGRLALGALTATSALLVCLPWTVRNCERMHACVLVSANAGWNLLIGAAPGATGAWVSLDELGVPPRCRTVWDEARKDACFEQAAREIIRDDPIHFIALVPRKLAVTFDYAGAAGWYLHSSNPEAFPEGAKWALGALETLWERVIVLGALLAAGWSRGPRGAVRRGVAIGSALFLLTRSAWVAHLGLCGVAALLGRQLPDRVVLSLAAATVFTTALTHAIFFGAGRYSLVCFPLLSALAGTVLTLGSGLCDTDDSKES